MAHVVAEDGRVVVAVDADHTLATAECREHVRETGEAVGVRPIDGVGVWRPQELLDVVHASRRRGVLLAHRHRLLQEDRRPLEHGDAVGAQLDENSPVVLAQLDLGPLDPARAAVGSDWKEHVQPWVAQLLDEEDQRRARRLGVVEGATGLGGVGGVVDGELGVDGFGHGADEGIGRRLRRRTRNLARHRSGGDDACDGLAPLKGEGAGEDGDGDDTEDQVASHAAEHGR